MGNKLLILCGLLMMSCAPLSVEEMEEQELSYTRPDSVPGTAPPETVIVVNPPNLESNPSLPDVDLACECHLAVSENRGLVCVRMECNESCTERTRDCATLFGGCTVR